jgi:uncharacterized protein YcgI (DUF1989 family)
MVERQLVPAALGAGLRLTRGQRLRVIDLEGGQSGDGRLEFRPPRSRAGDSIVLPAEMDVTDVSAGE